ncbi:hypothetical protein BDZ90DRAFT_234928 [Jaminaea rosea]|uniref:Uncharacterized protein n=1 Tax=Jaminaea rosea TaxID=1569628 RepID=A0A316UIB8_9BASI|nr:hypothetical protein BDZ90DRAFT_234928 [Jaminaea rosea]PWN24664.1 hypothetical protein BDZ90DRAFT_234928 [Jaminaea rosea]
MVAVAARAAGLNANTGAAGSSRAKWSASRSTSRSLMTALVLLAATAIATAFHLTRNTRLPSRHPLPYYLPPHHEQHIRTVPLNRTLGFEKIYVLSLPHRDDRHDEFSLLSSAYGRRGALRLLYLATRHVEDAVDWQTIRASREGWIDSYTVYPPLFDQFKMVNSSWNSDINAEHGKNVERRGRRWSPGRGRARHIRRSARREQGGRHAGENDVDSGVGAKGEGMH